MMTRLELWQSILLPGIIAGLRADTNIDRHD
jgi:hypothetical protein